MDKLTIRKLGTLDGEYDCDVLAMGQQGHPDCMNTREWYRVSQVSEVLPADYTANLIKGNAALFMAIALVVLGRRGRRVPDEAVLWEAQMVFYSRESDIELGEVEVPSLIWDIDPRTAEVDDSPPPVAPPESETLTSELSRSGGASSSPISDSPGSDPSRTGRPPSGTVTVGQGSPLLTSVT